MKKKQEVKGDSIPVVYMPRKPSPNGFLFYQVGVISLFTKFIYPGSVHISLFDTNFTLFSAPPICKLLIRKGGSHMY